MDEWLECGLTTAPADRAAAEAGVRPAYAQAGLPAPERFEWLGSPRAGAIRAAGGGRRRTRRCGPRCGPGRGRRPERGSPNGSGAAGWSRHWAATGARTWQLLTDRIVTPLRTRLGTELDEQGLPAARLALLDAAHGQHDGAWLGAFEDDADARRAGRGGPHGRLVVAVRAGRRS